MKFPYIVLQLMVDIKPDSLLRLPTNEDGRLLLLECRWFVVNCPFRLQPQIVQSHLRSRAVFISHHSVNATSVDIAYI